MSDSIISVDEFQALEQKVLRAVEIIRHEREARAAAEAQVAELRLQLDRQAAQTTDAQNSIQTLSQEREAVKLRVERMLRQMDDLL